MKKVARDRFRIRKIRPEQRRAIQAVLDGRDTLAVLPTGYGKSLIYQVPAMMFDRPTLVASPLIALMQDQHRALTALGVPVVRIDSTLRVAERRASLERVARGGPLIVLTTPETIESEDTRAVLLAARPKLLCVDEAHCISEWGHDFRRSYLRLGDTRKALKIKQVLALTATATPHVRQDIIERLQMTKPLIVIASPHRPNLNLSAEVVPGNHKIARAGQLLRRLRRPGIVYCSTKADVDDVFGALVKARIPCAKYHGGLTKDERAKALKKFMKRGRRMVMVATSAFGMGIDKPDIRYIMHFQVPGSLEQYAQEAGRAGRDGRASHCILLFDPADLKIQEHLRAKSHPGQKEHDTRRLQAMTDYVDTDGCRSVFIRRWFGEEDPPTCGNCDRCRPRR